MPRTLAEMMLTPAARLSKTRGPKAKGLGKKVAKDCGLAACGNQH